jgi:acetyltransferase-like isoleucine patch superfamily enzyme
MSRLHRYLATSDHPNARFVRWVYRSSVSFSIPAPKVIFKPLLWCILGGRFLWYTFRRVAIAEPLFKAYCKQYGRRLRTGIYLHWIRGNGDIVIGDDVYIDGKCSISFAARFADRPLLHIGDHTNIAHNCALSIGKEIRIGRHCLIAPNVYMFDSSGHARDPELRQQGLPPADDQVRPITIEDNVWIGRGAIIFPGVTIGEGSIVAAGAVVMMDVPPYTVVAGNPARKILPGIKRPCAPLATPEERLSPEPAADLVGGVQSRSRTEQPDITNARY